MRVGLTLRSGHFLVLGATACLAGVFIGSPYLFLDFQAAISGVLVEARTEHLSHPNLGYIEKIVFYLNVLSGNGITLGGMLIVVFWAVRSVIRKEKKNILLITTMMVFLVSMAALSLYWDRWILPLMPFLCVALSLALFELYAWITPKMGFRSAGILFTLALIALVVPNLSRSYLDGRSMAGKDTRTIANEWMTLNIPQGSRILMELYTPIFPKDQYIFYYVSEDGKIIQYLPEESYKQNFKATGHLGDLKNLQDVKDNRVAYFVMSHMYSRYLAEQESYSSVVSTYQDLMSQGQLIYHTSAVEGVNTGPDISVYQLTGANN